MTTPRDGDADAALPPARRDRVRGDRDAPPDPADAGRPPPHRACRRATAANARIEAPVLDADDDRRHAHLPSRGRHRSASTPSSPPSSVTPPCSAAAPAAMAPHSATPPRGRTRCSCSACSASARSTCRSTTSSCPSASAATRWPTRSVIDARPGRRRRLRRTARRRARPLARLAQQFRRRAAQPVPAATAGSTTWTAAAGSPSNAARRTCCSRGTVRGASASSACHGWTSGFSCAGSTDRGPRRNSPCPTTRNTRTAIIALACIGGTSAALAQATTGDIKLAACEPTKTFAAKPGETTETTIGVAGASGNVFFDLANESNCTGNYPTLNCLPSNLLTVQGPAQGGDEGLPRPRSRPSRPAAP